MSPQDATRHLGLDLGATNLKWAMVEQADGAWVTLAREQVATRLAGAPEDVPAAVVAQLGEVAAAAIRRCGPATSVGIGVPGLYDPAAGTARFLVNIPGRGRASPSPARSATRSASRRPSSTMRGRSGSPSCGSGPAGARLDDRADPWHRRRWRDRDRRSRRPRP